MTRSRTRSLAPQPVPEVVERGPINEPSKVHLLSGQSLSGQSLSGQSLTGHPLTGHPGPRANPYDKLGDSTTN